MFTPSSVLTRSTIAQPATPAVGDRYLIPAAATGVDWAGMDGRVGIYTAAGWRFAILPIGRELYVEDEDAKYYRNVVGAWIAGLSAGGAIVGYARASLAGVDNGISSGTTGYAFNSTSAPTTAFAYHLFATSVADLRYSLRSSRNDRMQR
jgi:hypothetical protein